MSQHSTAGRRARYNSPWERNMRRVLAIVFLIVSMVTVSFVAGTLFEEHRTKHFKSWTEFSMRCLIGGGIVVMQGFMPYCVTDNPNSLGDGEDDMPEA